MLSLNGEVEISKVKVKEDGLEEKGQVLEP